MVCDHLRWGWHGAIAYRTAFVHPPIDLAPKVVDEQERFDGFTIRISRIRNSGPDFSARLILWHERLISQTPMCRTRAASSRIGGSRQA